MRSSLTNLSVDNIGWRGKTLTPESHTKDELRIRTLELRQQPAAATTICMIESRQKPHNASDEKDEESRHKGGYQPQLRRHKLDLKCTKFRLTALLRQASSSVPHMRMAHSLKKINWQRMSTPVMWVRTEKTPKSSRVTKVARQLSDMWNTFERSSTQTCSFHPVEVEHFWMHLHTNMLISFRRSKNTLWAECDQQLRSLQHTVFVTLQHRFKKGQCLKQNVIDSRWTCAEQTLNFERRVAVDWRMNMYSLLNQVWRGCLQRWKNTNERSKTSAPKSWTQPISGLQIYLYNGKSVRFSEQSSSVEKYRMCSTIPAWKSRRRIDLGIGIHLHIGKLWLSSRRFAVWKTPEGAEDIWLKRNGQIDLGGIRTLTFT